MLLVRSRFVSTPNGIEGSAPHADSRTAGSVPYSYTRTGRKLNFAQASIVGEDLASARIYGTDFIAGDVVADADAMLASIGEPPSLSAAARSAVTEVQDLLDLINNGEVSFNISFAAGPPTPTLSLSSHGSHVPAI